MPHNLLVFSWKKPSFDFRKASQFLKMLLCAVLYGITWPREGILGVRWWGCACTNDHFPCGWPKHDPHTSIFLSPLCSPWYSSRLYSCTGLKITFKQEQLEVGIVRLLQTPSWNHWTRVVIKVGIFLAIRDNPSLPLHILTDQQVQQYI